MGITTFALLMRNKAAALNGNFAMTTPNTKDEPVEERIGKLIGTIFCLLLLTFFVWGYWTSMAANLGLF
jgi:hypothetical protein